jgi:hypothetical protein
MRQMAYYSDGIDVNDDVVVFERGFSEFVIRLRWLCSQETHDIIVIGSMYGTKPALTQ